MALSHGALKRGTVYVTLGRMEAKGFIRSEQEAMPPGAIGLPRRLYYPTPLGERVLACVEPDGAGASPGGAAMTAGHPIVHNLVSGS